MFLAMLMLLSSFGLIFTQHINIIHVSNHLACIVAKKRKGKDRIIWQKNKEKNEKRNRSLWAKALNERGGENLRLLANKLSYLRNGARLGRRYC